MSQNQDKKPLPTQGNSEAGYAKTFQLLIARYVSEHPAVPGLEAHIASLENGINWEGAAGLFQFGDDRPLDPRDAFRTASTTKTFTAAAVLRLVEQEKVDLSDKIEKYLSPSIVNRVHVLDGVNYGPHITIAQLLNHASGIYDYGEDVPWQKQVVAQPNKTWRPLELVEHAIDHGKPGFPPEKGFLYSDTGYVLLGLIIEEVTNQRLADAYRALLPFDELGLVDTYLESHEHPGRRGGERAHQYYADLDMTDYNPTFDTFGGGGLVSTCEDLARFIRGLFRGNVFEQQSTLRTMLEGVNPHSADVRDSEYAYGIQRGRFADEVGWFHSGFFGSFMIYFPSLDTAIAGSKNQHSESASIFIEDVIRLIKQN